MAANFSGVARESGNTSLPKRRHYHFTPYRASRSEAFASLREAKPGPRFVLNLRVFASSLSYWGATAGDIPIAGILVLAFLLHILPVCPIIVRLFVMGSGGVQLATQHLASVNKRKLAVVDELKTPVLHLALTGEL